MKKKIFLLILPVFLSLMIFSQNRGTDLSFTALNGTTYIQLDSIKVINLSQACDTVLMWPDTVLSLNNNVGINEFTQKRENIKVTQNYPNPMKDQTTISVYIPEKDMVNLIITDILGRKLINNNYQLESGYHTFRLTGGSSRIYLFSARWRNNFRSIKILKTSLNSNQIISLDYLSHITSGKVLKISSSIQNFVFNPGDELNYTVYANTSESVLTDSPENSKTYTFQFATDIPCPGTPTVYYEGQTYNTVQIFNQCWLKENLNVGTIIQGNQEMTDNDVIEKYCYYNNESNCTIYGGLYQWDEMMDYVSTEGYKGICPEGWHIPSDIEWCILENAADAGSIDCDITGGRGIDVGYNLRETGTAHWMSPNSGATNSTGFTALPGGIRTYNSSFIRLTEYSYSWTSSTYDTYTKLARYIKYNSYASFMANTPGNNAHGVRCLKDL